MQPENYAVRRYMRCLAARRSERALQSVERRYLGRMAGGEPTDRSVSSSLGFAAIVGMEPMLYAGLEYGSQTNAGVGASSIQFINDTITAGIETALLPSHRP